MPERGRSGERFRPHRCAFFAIAIPIGLCVPAAPALAAPHFVGAALDLINRLNSYELATLALVVGVFVFAAVSGVALVRNAARSSARLSAARREIALLREETERALALMLSEPQVVVVFRDQGEDPTIIGDPSPFTGLPVARRVLAFGAWLDPARAGAMEAGIDALRRRGEAFSLALVAVTGRHVEAEGRPIGGAAVLRLRDVTGAKLDHATLAERYRKLQHDAAEIHRLLESLPVPVWIREASGRIAYANRAYAAAVEAASAADAVARGLELLDSNTRAQAVRSRAEGKPFAHRLPAVVAGARRVLDVFEVGGEDGAAGIGIDATEAETLRTEVGRMISAHRRTLDQLATAVAIFGADERLAFHNAAYGRLFALDPAFLEERPTDSAILERLRAARRLPEQADFRAWKAQLHEAYRTNEAREHAWHLPGGRTLRVVTTPNPDGGVTYLFDDLTERHELERSHNALIQMQTETLDALAEAVAVFGSDGRLTLFNRALVEMWNLSAKELAERPHIEAVGNWCKPYLGASLQAWSALQATVTGLGERHSSNGRIACADGRVLDYTAVPLPDGATLITFRDMSDSARVERALMDRNEALEAADQLKNTFVGHVSYELRSPLTTIIGFAQLLDDPLIGPLNEKQREYVGHITESSAALLSIINDILDLATIDAGAMQLELGDVDARSVVEAAAEGIRTRLAERGVRLDIRVPRGIGSFVADERRARQVLFNLLSNAAGFSPYGATVSVSAERRADAMVFRVADEGPGIPSEWKDKMFARFETNAHGSSHRGAGLGLSIVRSLMELHGGSIAIETEPGKGTVAVCSFPLHAAAGSRAAE